MGAAPLSLEDFKSAVSELKAEIGENPQSIDFSIAYNSYLFLTKIFGTVNLKITDRGDRKRLEMLPKLD